MNCTNCGEVLENATCSVCNTNHKELLYRLADDSQVRRDYAEAYEYMELLKNSTSNSKELDSINRIMAKLDFAQTDLTGNKLKNQKRKECSFRVLKLIFYILILISLTLIFYNISINSSNHAFEIIKN